MNLGPLRSFRDLFNTREFSPFFSVSFLWLQIKAAHREGRRPLAILPLFFFFPLQQNAEDQGSALDIGGRLSTVLKYSKHSAPRVT